MASVQAICPGCSSRLNIPDDWVGRSVRCTNCGSEMMVGGSSSQMEEPIIRAPKQAKSTPLTGLLLLFAFFLVACGALFVFIFQQGNQSVTSEVAEPDRRTPLPRPKTTATQKSPVKVGPFPRSLLILNATEYLFCNPLTTGGDYGADPLGDIASRLALEWRIPRDTKDSRLYILGDTGHEPKPITRAMVDEMLRRFLGSLRPVDHGVVYFGGHVTSRDGNTYLIPTDGDPSDGTTLLSLDEFWLLVKESPARQKIIIFDVCRLNEDEDRVRPGSEIMTPEVEKALLNAPPGVQSVITCSAGQNAWEFRRTPAKYSSPNNRVQGSLFLSALDHVARSGALPTPKEPGEPIPLAAWMDAVNSKLKSLTSALGRPDQTVKWSGNGPTEILVIEDKQPLVERIEYPPPPQGLDEKLVDEIVRLLELPPIREEKGGREPSLGRAFTEESLKTHMPDEITTEEIRKNPVKYPFRAPVVAALDAIRKQWTSVQGKGLRTEFAGDTNEALKKRITEEQEVPARIILELEEQTRKLEELKEAYEKEESPYWKATYLYALGQLKARTAYLHEYDFALGNVKTDTLPKREAGQTGLQLVATEKLSSKKEIRDLAEASKQLFERLATEHKGTPWAILATRAKSSSLGLKWTPFTPTASTPPAPKLPKRPKK